ncbi:MFS general substrate transporter [Periconia macrospinosa]|uniref:MFS general substrate transporter n=1 Tax=Periconia macrospinosa TaxID=97972 RepID=A0A2V1E465_9PLEO|nr:MFS general substrate transporter [Periconia macrospinosa]
MRVLLVVGVFISNADSSFLMATHTVISSEFGALRDSSWLLTSFVLASAVTQPLYGKLSDIYGRKQSLIVAYFLFAVGCALVGIGTSMPQVILGRVISGLGSSGMTALVSILVTDLLPLRSVAAWRSYINIVATTARSIGGPLGGWLADTVGWRWSFIGQTPIASIAIVLIAVMVPSHAELQRTIKANSSVREMESEDEGQKGSKLSRVDFLGATFLTISILGLLLPLQVAGDRVPWSHPLILGSLGAASVFLVLFCVIEQRFAREPIIPLELLAQKDMVLSLIIMIAQATAQVGLMIVIPLYFQITTEASNSEAGAHLVPGVVGNAIGGLLSGSLIKRTGRYKNLTIFSLFFACLGYVLFIVRWRGNTINAFESLYNFPGGFGMGVVSSSLFVGIQAAIDPEHSAVAASTLYFAGLVGCMTGMAGTSAVLLGGLNGALDRRLDMAGFDGVEKAKIMDRAVSDFHYAHRAGAKVASIVVGSYVEALTYTHFFALACSLVALISTVFLKEYKL